MSYKLLNQIVTAPIVSLGDYIERVERSNVFEEYGITDVRGVSNTNGFIETRANVEGRSLKKFLVIEPNEFFFNRRTIRNCARLRLGIHIGSRSVLVS